MFNYTISYTHSTGQRERETSSITQLAEWLEELLNDRFAIQNSIVINTQEP